MWLLKQLSQAGLSARVSDTARCTPIYLHEATECMLPGSCGWADEGQVFRMMLHQNYVLKVDDIQELRFGSSGHEEFFPLREEWRSF